ncbi:MAG: MFS transporter [Sutterella wadsworthensis]
MVFAPARGRILMLSLVCMSVFLAEGAMLDWSAIYVHQVGGVDLKAAGVGYTLFVIAMAIARLMGDRMVERFGRARVLVTGMLLNIGTLVAMVLTDSPVVLFASLFVMGLGIANIAPVLISAASSVKGCDPTSAITTVTTIGYGGLMAGPCSARLHRPAQVARDRVSLHRRAAHDGASQRNPREQAAHREILNRRQA